MGREVKKVHLDFDWRKKTEDNEGYCEIWKGYILDTIKCFLCDGTSKNTKGKECPLCEGDGKVRPRIEPPNCWWDEKKNGFQIWEDTTEGSPVSPVFKKPEDLAKWMVENDTSIMAGTSYKAWLKMIKEEGSAPMGMISSKGMETGINALYKEDDKTLKQKEHKR